MNHDNINFPGKKFQKMTEVLQAAVIKMFKYF